MQANRRNGNFTLNLKTTIEFRCFEWFIRILIRLIQSFIIKSWVWGRKLLCFKIEWQFYPRFYHSNQPIRVMQCCILCIVPKLSKNVRLFESNVVWHQHVGLSAFVHFRSIALPPTLCHHFNIAIFLSIYHICIDRVLNIEPFMTCWCHIRVFLVSSSRLLLVFLRMRNAGQTNVG